MNPISALKNLCEQHLREVRDAGETIRILIERSNPWSQLRSASTEVHPAPLENFSFNSTTQATYGGNAQQTSTAVERKVLTKLFEENGKKIVAALSDQSVTELTNLVTAGDKTGAIAVRVINAVAQKDFGRLDETVHTLATHKGSFSVLRSFLEIFKTDDPFELCAKAAYRIPPRSEIPARLIEESGLENSPTNRREAVRGISGVRLRPDRVYHVYNSKNKTCPGVYCGIQSLTHVAESFGGEFLKLPSEPKENLRLLSPLDEVRQRLLALQNGEREDSLKRRGPLPHNERDAAFISELQKTIQAYRNALDNQLYGDTVLHAAVRNARLRSDPGGQYYGWFQRKYDLGTLPEAIEVAFVRLQTIGALLPAKERAQYEDSLLAYYEMHTFVDKRAALGGFVSDIDVLRALPAEDLLAAKHLPKILPAMADRRDLLNGDSQDLSLHSLNEIFQSVPLDAFREEMNQRALASTKNELRAAITLFRPLFIADGRFMEDSLSESVPAQRLSKSLYGARIFPEPFGEGKRALLTRNEFAAIKEAVFLDALVEDVDDPRFLRAKPIRDMGEMIESVIVAYRKASAALSALESAAALPVSLMDVTKNGPFEISIRVPAGSGFHRIEPLSQSYGLEWDEAKQRIEDRLHEPFRPAGYYNPYQAEKNAQIYHDERESELRELLKQAALFTPVSHATTLRAAAEQLKANPLVAVQEVLFSDALRAKTYLTPREVEILTKSLPALDYLTANHLLEDEKQQALLQRVATLEKVWMLVDQGYGKKLDIALVPLRDRVRETTTYIGGVRYRDEGKVAALENELSGRYHALTKMDGGKVWFDKMKHTFQAEHQRELVRADLEFTGRSVETVAKVSFSPSLYVAKELFARLSINHTPEHALKPLPYGFAWAGGEVRMTFGAYKDHLLSEVINSTRGRDYLAWICRGGFSEATKEIAKEAIRVPYRNNWQALQKWLLDNYR